MDKLKIERVTLEDLPVLVVTKDGGPNEAARAAFVELEAALSSLRGRRFYGYWEPQGRHYVACVVARDDDNVPGLDRGVLPGGRYARARLRGEPPELYERIGPTFDRVAVSISVDPSRPWLEHYRSETAVDVLVPIWE